MVGGTRVLKFGPKTLELCMEPFDLVTEPILDCLWRFHILAVDNARQMRGPRKGCALIATVALPLHAELGASSSSQAYDDSSSSRWDGSSCIGSVWPGGEQFTTSIAARRNESESHKPPCQRNVPPLDSLDVTGLPRDAATLPPVTGKGGRPRAGGRGLGEHDRGLLAEVGFHETDSGRQARAVDAPARRRRGQAHPRWLPACDPKTTSTR